MGHILSAIEAIDKLRFKPLKVGRPVKIVEAMVLQTGVVILKLEDGSFSIAGGSYGAAAVNNYAALGYGSSEPSQAVLYGLARMGVITRAQARDHIKRVKQSEKERSRKYTIARLNRVCEELGIDPPEVE